jgi:hypothetical protein
MVEHIHSTVFDQIHSGIFHDFPDLRFVLSVIALSFAFLAHGFGMVGAFYSHGQAIGEKPCTTFTKEGFFFFDLMDINGPEGKRRFFSTMVFTAVDPHKFHQRLNVGSFRFCDVLDFFHRNLPLRSVSYYNDYPGKTVFPLTWVKTDSWSWSKQDGDWKPPPFKGAIETFLAPNAIALHEEELTRDPARR